MAVLRQMGFACPYGNPRHTFPDDMMILYSRRYPDHAERMLAVRTAFQAVCTLQHEQELFLSQKIRFAVNVFAVKNDNYNNLIIICLILIRLQSLLLSKLIAKICLYMN
jgi:hypothetical protein